MSETIENQLAHRSVRRFDAQPISPEVLAQLKEATRRTATSCGVQMASIIQVNDPKKKREISQLCQQDYIADAPQLWIFLTDLYRSYRIVEEKGEDKGSVRGMDGFFQGFTEAVLMAQNLVNSAESLGLGTCFLGSILNDPERMIEILQLPKLTFPALGVMFGYPGQQPQLKPRMPLKLRMFEDTYQCFEGSYLEAFADYDQEMTTYYDTRAHGQRSDTFTDSLTRIMLRDASLRRGMLNAVRAQGFDLALQAR